MDIDKTLYDLGASINLMHFFFIMNKLGIGEVKPTMVSLQLVDATPSQAQYHA